MGRGGQVGRADNTRALGQWSQLRDLLSTLTDVEVLEPSDDASALPDMVFSANAGRALALAQRLESGICHVNGPTVQDEAQMPFGGVKASGYGRFGATAAIAEFTELRWITIQQDPRHYPF